MKSSDIRQKYLDFFKKQGHAVIPSASLIPENDPTVLFTTAGMHPLVPYLLGEKHPLGKRLVSVQKCIRTGDIDEVGDDTHLTFFEMLGNWSLGDYWKEEAIKWSFEFLTRELNIPLDKLAVSCFAGDKDAPKDEESAKIWKSLGIKEDRVAFLGKEDNWWGPAGKTGPCGPDTEMFYWKLDTPVPEKFDPEDENWIEIWNDVFMQYIKDENGNYLPAKQKNVDTGMGLERITAVLNGKQSVYETDLFEGVFKLIPNDIDEKERRIIADHSRAIVFLISDGVLPSKKKKGDVLRRLMRKIMINKSVDFDKIFDTIAKKYKEQYPEIKKELIVSEFNRERESYEKAYRNVISVTKAINKKGEILSGGVAFNISSTMGARLPDINQIVKETGTSITKSFEKEFKEAEKKHQELSRTASAGMFKGGLADASEATTKLHTAAHLMLAGLKKILGEHVEQKGSNINAERLRFDFTHKEKMTDEQKKDVENFVNDIINKDLPVVMEEIPLEKAKELAATGIFDSKYGDKVKVYTVADGDIVYSREICGGPHIEHTGVLGNFKIKKEESSSSGVRRIKATLRLSK